MDMELLWTEADLATSSNQVNGVFLAFVERNLSRSPTHRWDPSYPDSGGMKDHPESAISIVTEPQAAWRFDLERAGLERAAVELAIVPMGDGRIACRMRSESSSGEGHALIDSISDDLERLGWSDETIVPPVPEPVHHSNRGEASALIERLVDPERTHPLIVISEPLPSTLSGWDGVRFQHRGSEWFTDVDAMLALWHGGGLPASIVTLSTDACWALSEWAGYRHGGPPHLGCFDGGVRLYHPGLSRFSPLSDHPLWTRFSFERDGWDDARFRAGLAARALLAARLAERHAISLLGSGGGSLRESPRSNGGATAARGGRRRSAVARGRREPVRYRRADVRRDVVESGVEDAGEVLSTPIGSAPAAERRERNAIIGVVKRIEEGRSRWLILYPNAIRTAKKHGRAKRTPAEKVERALEGLAWYAEESSKRPVTHEELELRMRADGIKVGWDESSHTMGEFGHLRSFNGVTMTKHLTMLRNNNDHCCQIFFEIEENDDGRTIAIGYIGEHLKTHSW